MRRAWRVSKRYDTKVVRTRLQATSEACNLADFYRKRGHRVTSNKEWNDDYFFVADDDGGFTICISEIEVDHELWDTL